LEHATVVYYASRIATDLKCRRARNRVAQKSFRERQALHIKQLESSAADRSRNGDDQARALQVECDKLRQALLAARKRILGLTTALSGAADTIGTSLGIAVNGTTEHSDNDFTDQYEGNNAEGINVTGARLPRRIQQGAIAVLSNSIPEDAASVWQSSASLTSESVLTTMLPMDNGSGLSRNSWTTTWQQDRDHVAVDGTTYLINNNNPWLTSDIYGTDPMSTMPGISMTRPQAGTTCDGQLSYPPGKPNFPSQFSAHLAACEFFLVRNRVYKLRHKPGGSEA
jgi:hypothetical protein